MISIHELYVLFFFFHSFCVGVVFYSPFAVVGKGRCGGLWGNSVTKWLLCPCVVLSPLVAVVVLLLFLFNTSFSFSLS